MEITIREMDETDWKQVASIYQEGIATKKATFQTEVPKYVDWDYSHLKAGRFVAVSNNDVVGWVALSPTSSRCVYRGVAEVSIYIAKKARGQHVGETLLNALIKKSEEMGIWTLQSGIFEINEASIQLHKKCGFRLLGIRERIAQDVDGTWQNTVIMERRSQVI